MSQSQAQMVVNIEIPNDTISRELFDGARWNWRNQTQYRELQDRLAELAPSALILLEIGNENEGSYGAIAIMRLTNNSAILLTNYDAGLVELPSVRQMSVNIQEFERILTEVEPIRGISLEVPHYDFFSSDSSAYFLSWHVGKASGRISLMQSLVGAKRRIVGNLDADSSIAAANKVIAAMQSLVLLE